MSRKILSEQFRSNPKLAQSHELVKDELLVAVNTKTRKGIFYVDTFDMNSLDRIADRFTDHNLKKIEVWCKKALIPSAGYKIHLIDEDLINT